MTTFPAAIRRGIENAATRGMSSLLDVDAKLVEPAATTPTEPLARSTTPWAAQLEGQWSTIRRELDQLLDQHVALPSTDQLVGQPQGAHGDWTTYVLCWFGRWVEQNCQRCPQTTAMLRAIPGIQVGGFSVLGPRSHIPLHQGPIRATRYHLGIIVPGSPGDCRLRVGDSIVPWSERAGLAFDDRTPHEAWNDTDDVRYVLFVQVPVPLAGPRGVAHSAITRIFGSATRRIARSAAELDSHLNADLG